MPRIVSDSVDVYPFRRVNGRAQFLILLRRPGAALGGTWHGVHAKIGAGERAYEAALRELRHTVGFLPSHLYSADLVAQFYDHHSDAISLTPVFAALLEGPGPVILSPDYSDFAWCGMEEACSRLLASTQRWAVRHIAATIAEGGPEAEFYRIE
jgi:dihydroneopterin triphosphate diphosphatase